ncbi:MAG: DUF4340 domain-containing protein [Betaproteobacteria bacterium]|nr:DUF4340 domain-containing protein [Betaproteobacteria bacterium]MDH3436072.1 DUF4340 domain-containing protein [Betaproteobacteria bacterium]
MKQSFWLNMALLLGVAIVGAFVYLRPPADAPGEHAVSTLTPAAAMAVRIERPGVATIVLDKKQGTWFLVAPFAARADEFMVQRLLAVLQARTAHRFSAKDLARFNLERPQARLIIDSQPFDFGLVNELSHEQYVLTGDAVYALSTRYGLALPTRPEALASRRLLAPGEAPVRIVPPGFTVTNVQGRWVLDPAPQDWSQDEINRWVDEWRLASALRIEPHQQGEPQNAVRLELQNGQTLVVGILSRKPELVLLRSDQRLQYHFVAEVGKRLLSPPGAARNERVDEK